MAKRSNTLFKTVYFLGLITLITATIWALDSALIPLTVALFLGYLTFPLVTWLEHYHIHRNVTLVLTLSLLTAGLLLGAAHGLPLIVATVQYLFAHLPDYIAIAIQKINLLLVKFKFDYQINLSDSWQAELTQQLNWEQFNLPTMGKVLNQGANQALQLVMSVFYVLLCPIFYLYIIKDYEKIRSHLLALIPLQYQTMFNQFVEAADETLSAYLRGQLALAALLAVAYGLGLSLIDLPHGMSIGVLTGALCIIPYFGVVTGLCIAVLTALANSLPQIQIIYILGLFAVVHGIEAMYLTPKIIGAKVGLNPLMTLIALIIGGHVAGFWGILFAVPVTALLCRGIIGITTQYTNSLWFQTHDHIGSDGEPYVN